MGCSIQSHSLSDFLRVRSPIEGAVESASREAMPPLSRWRDFDRRTHDWPTQYFNAAARVLLPASQFAKTRLRILSV